MEVKYPNICIDPGINIGIALFDKHIQEPFYTKVISAQQADWKFRSKAILIAFENEVRKLAKMKLEHAYIEKPAFQEQGKGLVAAREGSFFKLVCVYGAMIWILDKEGYEIHEIEVYHYRGQLNKQKLTERLKQKFNLDYKNEHINDAVYLGLWLKGLV